MSIRSIALLALKIVTLAILFFIALTVGNMIFITPALPPVTLSPDQAAAALTGTLIIALVDTLIVTLIVLRSRWRGWRLALGVAFSLYGVTTVMAQIETAWFAPAMTTLRITPELLRGLFLRTVPMALIWVPLAVALLSWGWRLPAPDEQDHALPESAGAWAWRLAAIAAAYLALYFSFGYVVAWQNPEVRALYDSGANQQVFAYERLIPFQILRALLWVLFALPVIRMTAGSRWWVALMVGLLFALPMNIFHVIPNDLMSPSVRLSHFVETASSNFLFGLIVTGLLLWVPARVSRPLAPLAGQMVVRPFLPVYKYSRAVQHAQGML
jgi:hypothetical protein